MSASLNVARDFSPYPAGRYRTDGPFSGEGLRSLLAASLRGGEVTVLLDGTMGYGSGFLEEAFGGLVRECKFTVEELRRKLKLESEDRELVDEIWSYVEDAGSRLGRNPRQ